MVQHVFGFQEPTYTPEVEELTAATTTQEIIFGLEGHVPLPPPLTGTEFVKDQILKVFPDAPIMIYVAMCESGLDPLADRGNLNVDVGLFQINQVHLPRLRELGLDRRDLQDNLFFARMLYDSSGLSPWYMSEHCWSKYL